MARRSAGCRQSTSQASALPGQAGAADRGLLWGALLVLAAGLFAWWDVPGFGFKFDDNAAICQNAALVSGDWWHAAFGQPHQPLANRPLSCWTLAVAFQWFGYGSVSPHLGNLILHLGAGVLLFALLRGTLRAPNLRERLAPDSAARLALGIALVWVVHPLATDAVAYATQRSTLLASLGLLGACYGTLRAHDATQPWRWRAVAVAAMALGIASKEDLVAGPLLIALYQRAFLLPDWRSLRTQAGFLGAQAATWLVLAACIALGPTNQTVGYATAQGVTAWQWLLTQAGVVAHYVRLAAWPDPLRGAYSDAVVKEIGPALLPGAFVLALLGLTLVCWFRRPAWHWLGFLGALFFLWLAPTSSVMPIVTEIAAERRMYLPMLFVLVPLLLGGRWLLQRVFGNAPLLPGAAALLAAVVGLAFAARSHALAYASEAAFWQDAYDKRDPDSRGPLAAQILTNLGTVLLNGGRAEAAHPLFDQAMQCEHVTHGDRTCWATSLQQRGRTKEAIAALEQVIVDAPNYPEAHGILGACLLLDYDRNPAGKDDPRLARAIAALQRAVELAPLRLVHWNSLGGALARAQRPQEALAAYQRAIALPFEQVHPFASADDLLRKLGRAAEADAMWEQLLRRRPRELQAHLHLAGSALEARNWPLARTRLQAVLAIQPGHPQAQQALREVEAQIGR